MKKVSIIIPVYNVEKYLRKCLDSVVNQTCKDIEIIIINDGSTDNSLEICKEYSKNDPRIELIDKKNEGVSKARNTGLACATGEYVCFVDSDDWIELNMIEKLYNSSVINNADFCMCNYIKENGTQSEYIKANIYKEVLIGSEIKDNLLIPLIERDDNEKEHDLEGFRTPWGKFFRRQIIDKYNIKFREDLIIGEDFIFDLEFLINASKAVINNGFYYHYLNNVNSATMKYKKDCWKSIYKNTIIYLENFLNKNNIYLETKSRVNKLIIKYFFISLMNEARKDNPNKRIQKIKTIKEMCEDKIVVKSLKNINLSIGGKRNKLVLLLAKYRLLYLINIIKSY